MSTSPSSFLLFSNSVEIYPAKLFMILSSAYPSPCAIEYSAAIRRYESKVQYDTKARNQFRACSKGSKKSKQLTVLIQVVDLVLDERDNGMNKAQENR